MLQTSRWTPEAAASSDPDSDPYLHPEPTILLDTASPLLFNSPPQREDDPVTRNTFGPQNETETDPNRTRPPGNVGGLQRQPTQMTRAPRPVTFPFHEDPRYKMARGLRVPEKLLKTTTTKRVPHSFPLSGLIPERYVPSWKQDMKNQKLLKKNAYLGGVPSHEHDESLYLARRELKNYNSENRYMVEDKTTLPSRGQLLKPLLATQNAKHRSSLMRMTDKRTAREEWEEHDFYCPIESILHDRQRQDVEEEGPVFKRNNQGQQDKAVKSLNLASKN